MENASKALEMAASVLIGMLIIGMLVFAYSRITELKKTEENSKISSQSADFNKNYETYNRDVYGSELFSLANQIQDYNNKYESDGYTAIELSVTMKNVSDFEYFTKKNYNEQDLIEKYEELSNQIKTANKTIKDKAISYWSSSSSELRANFNTTTNPTLSKMIENIRIYDSLVNEQEDVARKIFRCTEIEYDKNNGRIIKMTYSEK